MKENNNLINENVLGGVDGIKTIHGNKGKHRSPSTEFKKGLIPWMTGKKHDEETLKKIRLKKLGKKLSPESIRKRTETRRKLFLEGKLIGPMKGKHQTEKARRLIGIASKNRVVTDITREKLRLSRLGKIASKETLRRLSESHKGHVHSEEHKANIRASVPSGKDCYLWKGGISSLSIWIRKSLLYKKWLNICMKRDNWSCCVCHKRGGDLHVHHILFFSDILENNSIKTKEQAISCKQLWDISNGVTLCEECHRITHKHLKEIENETKNLKPLIFYDQLIERRYN